MLTQQIALGTAFLLGIGDASAEIRVVDDNVTNRALSNLCSFLLVFVCLFFFLVCIYFLNFRVFLVASVFVDFPFFIFRLVLRSLSREFLSFLHSVFVIRILPNEMEII